MPSDVDWITTALTKARLQSAGVPEPVWVQVETLLRGKFSERGMPAVELAGIAMQLIDAMAPAPSKLEEQ